MRRVQLLLPPRCASFSGAVHDFEGAFSQLMFMNKGLIPREDAHFNHRMLFLSKPRSMIDITIIMLFCLHQI